MQQLSLAASFSPRAPAPDPMTARSATYLCALQARHRAARAHPGARAAYLVYKRVYYNYSIVTGVLLTPRRGTRGTDKV